MADCVFCKIVTGEIPCKKVFETEDVLVFRDIHPQAPTHLLIIPKNHIENLFFVSDNDVFRLGNLLLAAKTVAGDLQIGDKGFKLKLANGKNAGQEVDHLHIHFLSNKYFT